MTLIKHDPGPPFDSSVTYAGSITTGDVMLKSVGEIAQMMRDARAQREFHNQQLREAVEGMEPCGACGRKIRFEAKGDPGFHGGPAPYDRLIVCRHVRDELRKLSDETHVDPRTVLLPGMPDLFGIVVCVAE